jgi:hypothetical protein
MASCTPNQPITSLQMTGIQHLLEYSTDIATTCSGGSAAHHAPPPTTPKVQQRWYIPPLNLHPSPSGKRYVVSCMSRATCSSLAWIRDHTRCQKTRHQGLQWCRRLRVESTGVWPRKARRTGCRHGLEKTYGMVVVVVRSLWFSLVEW